MVGCPVISSQVQKATKTHVGQTLPHAFCQVVLSYPLTQGPLQSFYMSGLLL